MQQHPKGHAAHEHIKGTGHSHSGTQQTSHATRRTDESSASTADAGQWGP